jgi:hypothetical protein
MLDVQLSGLQTEFFTYSWQAPAPSHLPLAPQPAAPVSLQMGRGSALPTATMVHLPWEPGSPQLRQAPVQAFSQQNPSTHWPEVHSVPALQAWPFCLGPQLWERQLWPVSQSESTLQNVVQAPYWHW